MDLPYGVTCRPVPEHVSQNFVERPISVMEFIQYKVDWGRDSRKKVPPPPVFQIIAPEAPQFWGVARDSEPVVANEEDVVRILPCLGGAAANGFRHDV